MRRGVTMDLDKVIKQTQECVWQLKKLDIDDKYERYSMDRLMAEISAEVKRMKDDHVVTTQEVCITDVPVVLYQENMSNNGIFRKIDKKLSSRKLYQALRSKAKKMYRFFVPYLTVDGEELLKYEGEMFARVAYKSILQRDIDRDALTNIVDGLETRKVTKINVLNTLCKSEEGKKYGITVKGLRWKLFKQNLKNGVKRIPIIGYALRWVKCIILLPRMFANAQNSINDLVLYDKKKTNQLIEQQRILDVLRRDLEFAVFDMQDKVSVLRRDLEFAVCDQRGEKEGWEQEFYNHCAALVEDFNKLEDGINEGILRFESHLEKLQKEHQENLASSNAEVNLMRREYDKKIAMLLEKLVEAEMEIKNFYALQNELEQLLVQERVLRKEMGLELEEVCAMQSQLAEKYVAASLAQKENAQEILSVKGIFDNAYKTFDQKLTSIADVSLRNKLNIEKVSTWREEQVQKELANTSNLHEVKALLDEFYVNYNDTLMADSREEVKERQRTYLPFIENHLGNKKQKLVMLDIGCGEGEFVELLNANGYPAYGIDSNPMVIQKVRNIRPSIRIVESDAIEYLASLPSESVDFISCFHMVEHLETVETLKLLKEMYRVLKVGGSLILETPNPLNILISTYYFYMDPTHKKQIPYELLKLMVSNAGFKVEECRMLRPLCFVPYEYDDPNDKIKDIVFRFNMEQAYSIMAVKE